MTVCEPFSRHLPRHLAHHRTDDLTLTWASSENDGPRTWGELAGLDWSRFRLVIGAGGASGGAFAAGVLLALATDHHVDLGNASHLVGTSAGSVIAGLIAMGLGADDLAAIVSRAPHWVSPLGGSHDFTFSDEVPPLPKWRSLVRAMGPRDIVRSANLAANRRYRALWLHCVRPGTFDVSRQLRFIPELSWPTRRLSICCTDAATADRVVFERGSGVTLSDAISASCAVPGVMRPVSIGRRLVVDGGVVSPTNADIALEDDETTLTVVISPMSGSGAHSAVGRASSIFAASRLVGELRRSRPEGGVLVIEPSGPLGALVMDDALDSSNTTSILGASFLAPSRAIIDHRHIPARKSRAGHGPVTNQWRVAR